MQGVHRQGGDEGIGVAWADRIVRRYRCNGTRSGAIEGDDPVRFADRNGLVVGRLVEKTEAEIVDRVVSTSQRTLTRARPVREFTSIHMGSARYFHPSQLTVTAETECASLHAELMQHGEVTHRTRIELRSGNSGEEGPELGFASGSGSNGPPAEVSR